MWKKGLILQIMSQRLRAQTYRYITDNNIESKKARGTKKCTVKRKLEFENYKNCLHGSQLENKIIHLNTNNTDVKGFRKIKKNLQKTIK